MEAELDRRRSMIISLPKLCLTRPSSVAVLLPVGLETQRQQLVQFQVVRGGIGLELAPKFSRHPEIQRG